MPVKVFPIAEVDLNSRNADPFLSKKDPHAARAGRCGQSSNFIMNLHPQRFSIAIFRLRLCQSG